MSKQVWRCIHFMYCVICFVYVTKQMQSVKIWFKIDNLHLIELQNHIDTSLQIQRNRARIRSCSSRRLAAWRQALPFNFHLSPGTTYGINYHAFENRHNDLWENKWLWWNTQCVYHIHSQQNIKRRKICDYRHCINFATFQSSYM